MVPNYKGLDQFMRPKLTMCSNNSMDLIMTLEVTVEMMRNSDKILK